MSFNFKRKIVEFKKKKNEVPVVIANMAKNHYLQNFRQGGFVDEQLDPWQKRKANAPRNSGRALLVDSGALRRSIRVVTATFKKIEVGSVGIKYASRHNQGLDGMPKRQFIGSSRALSKKIRAYLKREFKKTLE